MRLTQTFRNILLGGLMLGTTVPAVADAKPISKPKATSASMAIASVSAHAAANVALQALRPLVRNLSHPRALETALNAYYGYRASHPGEIKKPYLYFVDFGQAQNA